MARFAAIDLGSNALRLRIAEVNKPPPTVDGARGMLVLRDVLSQRAPVRLGNEVYLTGKLASGALGQACEALREFRVAMDAAKVDAYRAIATSAVRESENGATLVERVRREAGIELEIIEGVEEARLVQLAVSKRLGMDRHHHQGRALLFDVGGGSTEFTVIERGQAVLSCSLPLGSVRLMETFLPGSGPAPEAQLRLLDEQVDRTLGELDSHLAQMSFDAVVGTGGNIETLAGLCPAAAYTTPHGDPCRSIDVAAMQKLAERIAGMSSEQRRQTFSLRADRADTILPAARIFLRIAKRFAAPRLLAPGVGLKEGLLLELAQKHFSLWDHEAEAHTVLASCRRLGQRFHFDEAHANLVERFAGTLFDATRGEHRLADRDRLLLRAAALLHDVGDFVSYHGHHKHTFYLVMHSDIMGLSAHERALVANVARYHRKSAPSPAHENFRELSKDDRGRVRVLSALLRIADALDREHLSKVEGLSAQVDAQRRRLRLQLQGHDERGLEEWSVRAKSELLREVLDLQVDILGRGGRLDEGLDATPPSSRPKRSDGPTSKRKAGRP